MFVTQSRKLVESIGVSDTGSQARYSEVNALNTGLVFAQKPISIMPVCMHSRCCSSYKTSRVLALRPLRTPGGLRCSCWGLLVATDQVSNESGPSKRDPVIPMQSDNTSCRKRKSICNPHVFSCNLVLSTSFRPQLLPLCVLVYLLHIPVSHAPEDHE